MENFPVEVKEQFPLPVVSQWEGSVSLDRDPRQGGEQVRSVLPVQVVDKNIPFLAFDRTPF